MDRLERLIARETFAEIVRELTPIELYIAQCRLEGMSDRAIGLQLGVSRRLVSHIMLRARRRIAVELPGTASWLEGRRLRPRRGIVLKAAPWGVPDPEGR